MGYDERRTINLVLDYKDKPTLKLELCYSSKGVTLVGTCHKNWTHEIVTITDQGELIKHDLSGEIGLTLDGYKVKEKPYGPPKMECPVIDCILHDKMTGRTEDICTDCIHSTSSKENRVDHAEFDKPDKD